MIRRIAGEKTTKSIKSFFLCVFVVYNPLYKYMSKPNGKVAIVTGASRGVGKGIALELIDAGATVYITGRTVEDMKYIEGKGVALQCDHRDDLQVETAFRRIADEQGRLDILVNN